jgi:hypothetical protein
VHAFNLLAPPLHRLVAVELYVYAHASLLDEFLASQQLIAIAGHQQIEAS